MTSKSYNFASLSYSFFLFSISKLVPGPEYYSISSFNSLRYFSNSSISFDYSLTYLKLLKFFSSLSINMLTKESKSVILVAA